MRITVPRRRLEKLIREELGLGNGNIEGMRPLMDEMILESSGFAATAAEEAAKINSQVGTSYSTDQSYWGGLGIVTGEDLARSVLAQTYSDRFKSINGFRPRWVKFDKMSIDKIQVMIDELDDQEDDWSDEAAAIPGLKFGDDWSNTEDEYREWDAQRGAEEEEEERVMRTPEEGEGLPKTMGMGRRPLEGPARLVRRGRKISEEKHMKVSRGQIREMIQEFLRETDVTDAMEGNLISPGPADDMAVGLQAMPDDARDFLDDMAIQIMKKKFQSQMRHKIKDFLDLGVDGDRIIIAAQLAAKEIIDKKS